MPTAGTAPSVAPPTVENDDAEAQRVMAVYNCSRLGLTANPPGFSFLDFFRFGRPRR